MATARVAVALGGSSGGQSTIDGVLPVAHSLQGASSGLSASTGTLQVVFIAPIYGMWNGQVVVAMQYGDKQVTAWLMVPS